MKIRIAIAAAILALLTASGSCDGPVSPGCQTASTSGHCPGGTS